ncbi:PfkB family carbohydrate kinase [Inediibacterium massiliense]|uniref:PfkB family carbohydrate kinase n=1 Tax=Inediibacterium massiliense TaxID=1658111 RepID=UPI000A626ADD|nr:PfkB family carbohydrate kinase [Inediibacterium massiliense]
MSNIKTLVLGAAIVDIVMKIPILPQTGEDITSKEQTIMVGGCAYNVSNILKNFHVDHSLIVPVGNGPYGDLVKKELKRNDYKIFIEDHQKDNGYCLCLVEDTGERTFITLQGIECDFQSQWLENLDTSLYQNIYISGYEIEGPSGHVISSWLCKQNIKNIYFAPGPRITYIAKPVLKKIFDLSPIIHLNEKEILDYTGEKTVVEASNKLYAQTNNIVFVTLGPNGVMFFNGKDHKLIKGRSANVVDTIGAGDSHIGTIIAATSMGYDYENACKIANMVSAKIVETQGPIMKKEEFSKEDYVL